ncbi:MAG: DUF488 domain-containing protein [Chloroflexi bacterium]|nr:DUF488 domain-containing protein [Chloroflexota bacterium]
MIKSYTIGYEKFTLDEFLVLLKAHEIRQLIDVRYNPFSHKPGFSRSHLTAKLQESGIDYIHCGELGSLPTTRKNLQDSGDYKTFFKSYREHLRGKTAVLTRAVELLQENSSAIMCFEDRFTQCHRSALCTALIMKANGNELGFEHLSYLSYQLLPKHPAKSVLVQAGRTAQ